MLIVTSFKHTTKAEFMGSFLATDLKTILELIVAERGFKANRRIAKPPLLRLLFPLKLINTYASMGPLNTGDIPLSIFALKNFRRMGFQRGNLFFIINAEAEQVV